MFLLEFNFWISFVKRSSVTWLYNSIVIFIEAWPMISCNVLGSTVCNRWFTMASADFSSFVVTDGFHTLFPSADETSLGTTRHFLSIYLPHLLQIIPSSYWTSTCYAALSLTVAWCDFYSSDRRFASTFLQIPLALIMVVAMNRTPLVSAVSFPLLGRIRNFHPLATCAARRT